ncbi:hypothetical protein OG864_52195 [Streptomyces sp. NBC_00124]|uniref:hypothetical protein n=1 Tax=Streptomyces sp. NBC_00124 TaxID=2975662 RepID=UPI002255D95B|nr:hypothetical protein [Streptomyces sp. NBC_00124]MCX5367235.1 hypothetical protein [Streptomyces sp. NBC_00124]
MADFCAGGAQVLKEGLGVVCDSSVNLTASLLLLRCETVREEHDGTVEQPQRPQAGDLVELHRLVLAAGYAAYQHVHWSIEIQGVYDSADAIDPGAPRQQLIDKFLVPLRYCASTAKASRSPPPASTSRISPTSASVPPSWRRA